MYDFDKDHDDPLDSSNLPPTEEQQAEMDADAQRELDEEMERDGARIHAEHEAGAREDEADMASELAMNRAWADVEDLYVTTYARHVASLRRAGMTEPYIPTLEQWRLGALSNGAIREERIARLPREQCHRAWPHRGHDYIAGKIPDGLHDAWCEGVETTPTEPF